MSDIKAYKDTILLLPNAWPSEVTGDIAPSYLTGAVYSVGPGVKGIKEGMTVYFRPYSGTEMACNGMRLLAIDDYAVIAYED